MNADMALVFIGVNRRSSAAIILSLTFLIFLRSSSEAETRIECDAARRRGPGRQSIVGRVDRRSDARDGHVVQHIARVHGKCQRPPALPETEGAVQADRKSRRVGKEGRSGWLPSH